MLINYVQESENLSLATIKIKIYIFESRNQRNNK